MLLWRARHLLFPGCGAGIATPDKLPGDCTAGRTASAPAFARRLEYRRVRAALTVLCCHITSADGTAIVAAAFSF